MEPFYGPPTQHETEIREWYDQAERARKAAIIALEEAVNESDRRYVIWKAMFDQRVWGWAR